MLWFPLSLLSALTLATADALTKRFFGNLSPYEMGTIRLIYTLPWLVISFFLSLWLSPTSSTLSPWHQDCPSRFSPYTVI